MKLPSLDKFHPASWWVVGLAVVGTGLLSADPLTLVVLSTFSIGLIFLGARQRINESKFTNSLKFYVLLASAVLLTRVLFRIIFGNGQTGESIVLDLPRLQLHLGFGSPVDFLGPVSAVSLEQGLVEGLRLAAIILGIGLASTLANPRRLLKSTPAALYEIATSVAIAINLAPQLIKSLQRVRRARQLRVRSRGIGALTGIVIPVLEDTIHSSLALAASMESRGFGQAANTGSKTITRLISVAAISLMTIGSYLLVTQGQQNFYLIAASFGMAIVSVWFSSRRNFRTRLVSNKFSNLDLIPLVMTIGIVLLAVLGGRS